MSGRGRSALIRACTWAAEDGEDEFKRFQRDQAKVQRLAIMMRHGMAVQAKMLVEVFPED
jgi:hypothetical protein